MWSSVESGTHRSYPERRCPFIVIDSWTIAFGTGNQTTEQAYRSLGAAFQSSCGDYYRDTAYKYAHHRLLNADCPE